MKNHECLSMSLLAILLCLLSTGADAATKSITLFPFEGESVHPQIRGVARDGLAIFLVDNGFDVRANAAEAPPEGAAEADELAKKAKCTQYLRGKITRFGQRAIVQVLIFQVGTPTPTATYRLTAATPEDLETVTKRLAKSIATGEAPTSTADIHSVTKTESRRLTRRKAHSSFSVGLGGTAIFQDDVNFLPGLSLGWLFDNRNVLFDLKLNALNADEFGNLTEIGLGAYYPFSDDDISLYAGGGLSLGSVHLYEDADEECIGDECDIDSTDGAGLNVFGEVGALIGRASTVVFRPSLSYFVALYEVADEPIHGLSFRVSVGF
ncbi:MAG: hypothetical protein VX589_18830 [Myxococcota bacterium]|nr:hypothetical protein [Myxococcota bacterium]